MTLKNKIKILKEILSFGIVQLFLFIILMGIIGGIFSIYENKLRDKGCISLGYEKFISVRDYPFSFCRDSEGNLYYVTWKWDKFPSDISVKEISVGDN